MKKYIIPLILVGIVSLVFYRCTNQTKANDTAEKTTLKLNLAADAVLETALKEVPIEKNIIAQSKQKITILNSKEFIKLFINDYPVNGFFGTNNYRIEYYLKSMVQNKKNLSNFKVSGLTRHKNIITPFEGEMNFSEFYDNDKAEDKNNKSEDQFYSIVGNWNFKEDSKQKYSGDFSGLFFADLKKEKDNLYFENGYEDFGKVTYFDQLCAKGNGLLLKGTWQSYTDTNDIKIVRFTNNIEHLGNKLFKNFSFGEREMIINEKYAKYGWSEIYSNNEWWLNNTKYK